MDGGTCEDIVLSIQSPGSGAVYLTDAGTFTVIVTGTQWNGTSTGTLSIPVVTDYGQSATVTSGVGSSIAVPIQAGSYTLTAGWDGGVAVSVPFFGASCTKSCAEWQECIPTNTGGQCTTADLSLSWSAPASNAAFNTATVAGQLQIQKKDGGVILPTSVPVRGPGGTVSFGRTGTVANGTLSLTPPDGTETYVAGWEDGGVTATLNIKRDTTGPVLTVTVLDRPADGDSEPGFSKYWKKDEKALVKVTVDDVAVTLAPANVTTPWSGTGTVSVGTGCGCAGAGCFCFSVDLSGAPVAGIRGSQNITVGPVNDAVGNPSNTAAGTIYITRFKWQRSMGSMNTLASGPLPVAISSTGLVVTGTPDVGGTSPAANRVLVFTQAGSSPWAGAVSTSTVTAGPVVSATDIWVGTLDSMAQLQPISLATGVTGTPECTQSNSAKYAGHVALATVALKAGGTGERPLAVRGGELRVGDGTCNANSLSGVSEPAHTVVRESGATTLEAFVAGNGGTLSKAVLDSNRMWTPKGAASLSVAPADGLFHDGTYVGGGGGGVSSGGVFATGALADLSGSTSFTSYVGTPAPEAGPPSVGAGYVVYGDSGGNLVRVPFTGGSFPPGVKTVVVSTGSSTRATTPIIGAGGHIYAIAANGTLRVSTTTDLTKEWDAAGYLPAAGGGLGQPALDVLRDVSGAKQCKGLGVLYVPASAPVATNTVATLTAIIVDSQGLEPTAPWPKYQRDNANTGNISRSLANWICP